MNATRTHRLVAVLTAALLAGLAGSRGASEAQENAVAFERWSKLEVADQLRDYRNALREGTFDAAARAFLTTTALPQLALPANRSDIDRVRRKMFDRLCVVDQGPNSKPAIVDATLQTVATFMTEVFKDQQADPVVRVNAALLVGELRVGAKPWAPAVVPLTAALTDDGLPPAVRIAAAAGLARHVDADPAARAADAGPALVKVVAAPLAGVDPLAAAWLRSRALAMLARMGPAAPAGTAAAASRLLLDAKQPVDLRVRAAATVGACVKAAGDTDAAAAVAAIRDLATAALTSTKADFDRRALATRLAGGQAARPPAVTDGLDAETSGPSQAYRRDAWRLATLADALAPAGGSGGITAVAGATAATATALAQTLREGAGLLDAQPAAESLTTALESLAAADAGPAAAAPGAGENPPPSAPADEPTPPGVDGVPFGG